MASRTPPGRRGRATRPTGRAAGQRGLTGRAAKKATASGPQITSRAVILLSVVLLLLGSYTASLRAWWGARQDVQTTKAERVELKREIADLKNEKQRFDDPAFIRQQARERFGWVMPGEVGYRVIGADGSVRGEVPELDEPPEVKTPQWYDRLWGTVDTAGRGDADTAPTPSDEPRKFSE